MKKVSDPTRGHSIEYFACVIRDDSELCKSLLENPEEALKMAAKTVIYRNYIVPGEALSVLDNFMVAAVRVRTQLLLEQRQQQKRQQWKEQTEKAIVERFRNSFV